MRPAAASQRATRVSLAEPSRTSPLMVPWLLSSRVATPWAPVMTMPPLIVPVLTIVPPSPQIAVAAALWMTPPALLVRFMMPAISIAAADPSLRITPLLAIETNPVGR